MLRSNFRSDKKKIMQTNEQQYKNKCILRTFCRKIVQNHGGKEKSALCKREMTRTKPVHTKSQHSKSLMTRSVKTIPRTMPSLRCCAPLGNIKNEFRIFRVRAKESAANECKVRERERDREMIVWISRHHEQLCSHCYHRCHFSE